MQDEGDNEMRIEVELDIPCKASEADVFEWLRYNLGIFSQMQWDNPLSNFDLEAKKVKIIQK